MAELPPQSKVKIREIVQLELEITALIQETTNINESQDELNQVNTKVKKSMQSLRRKIEVFFENQVKVFIFVYKYLYSLLNVSIL